MVLKLILPERANDATAVQMFLDEARLAAALNHQNVAQVFEVGEDVGIHFLAMEYVHGQDLRALLAKAGSQGTRVPLELALTVVAGAAAGLHHAHERRGPDGIPLGIVHRDVSPSNIMIGYDGSVKLLDFGIAKATSRSIETQSGIIKGKFAYMAPEQCRGRDVDRRSDVFSLGIILYEITTQHRCFRADSDFDTMHRIVTGDVVRPTRLVQGYPQALEAVVMKALAVDVNQRYQSTGQLLEALESFAVSARMSLSTMGLGRFMREMFGDISEPWLTTSGRFSAPQQPKESTISNTNGTSGSQDAAARMKTAPLAAGEPPHVPLQGPTILDLPRGGGDRDFDEPQVAEWNAKSYPAAPPSDEADTLPPADVVRAEPRRTPMPDGKRQSQPQALASPPQGSQPLPRISEAAMLPPPPTAFATKSPSNSGSGSAFAHQKSGSAPAIQANPIPSTRHGYASGQPGMSASDMSYPRYEPDIDVDFDENVRIRSRAPLFIGLGVLAVGAAIVVVIAFWGKGPEAAAPSAAAAQGDAKAAVVEPPPVGDKAPDKVDPPEVKDTKEPKDPVVEPKPEEKHDVAVENPPKPADPVPDAADENISIHVVSDPAGADVLINAKVIGTTPLDAKWKKGSGSATLVVHRNHFKDEVSKLDLSGDFSKTVTLKKLVDDRPRPRPPTPPPTPPHNPTPPTHEPHVVQPPPPPPPPAKPDCQPPGQVDPFDKRPICKS